MAEGSLFVHLGDRCLMCYKDTICGSHCVHHDEGYALYIVAFSCSLLTAEVWTTPQFTVSS